MFSSLGTAMSIMRPVCFLQLAAVGYQMTGTAKVLIAVILFLLESLLLLGGGFAVFLIVSECLQDSKVFGALVYVIYLTLW